MSDRLPRNYQTISDMDQAEVTFVSGKKFFVHLAGKTNNAHREYVAKLKGIGKVDVASAGESDFVVVFCPAVSRVGTDISMALSNTPVGKPVILVVMHHTFDSDNVVAESRRQVTDRRVVLTVDCLFYESNLLKSNRNDIAWHEVETFLGSSRSVVPTGKNRYLVIACLVVVALLVAVVIIVIIEVEKKKH